MRYSLAGKSAHIRGQAIHQELKYKHDNGTPVHAGIIIYGYTPSLAFNILGAIYFGLAALLMIALLLSLMVKLRIR